MCMFVVGGVVFKRTELAATVGGMRMRGSSCTGHIFGELDIGVNGDHLHLMMPQLIISMLTV